MCLTVGSQRRYKLLVGSRTGVRVLDARLWGVAQISLG